MKSAATISQMPGFTGCTSLSSVATLPGLQQLLMHWKEPSPNIGSGRVIYSFARRVPRLLQPLVRSQYRPPYKSEHSAAPCDCCPQLARSRAEHVACSAAQAFMLGSKNWALAPRLDAAHWRWEFAHGRARSRAASTSSTPPRISCARSHRSHALRSQPGGNRSRSSRRTVISAAHLAAFSSMLPSVVQPAAGVTMGFRM